MTVADDPSPEAKLRLVIAPNNAVVPLARSELPTPPPFTPDPGLEAHCDVWEEWLHDQGAAILTGADIEFSAPAESAATITAVRAKVLARHRPRRPSTIVCLDGAGGVDSWSMRINLDRPDLPVVVESEEPARQVSIPDGSYVVAAGQTEIIALYPRGAEGSIYEWMLEVDVTVDTTKRTVHLGSKNRPIRSWFGELPPGTDYDMRTRRWGPPN